MEDDRLPALEREIAEVEQALATLEDLHTQTRGRGGESAAQRIAAIVSADRFPTGSADPQS